MYEIMECIIQMWSKSLHRFNGDQWVCYGPLDLVQKVAIDWSRSQGYMHWYCQQVMNARCNCMGIYFNIIPFFLSKSRKRCLLPLTISIFFIFQVRSKNKQLTRAAEPRILVWWGQFWRQKFHNYFADIFINILN